jgi:HD-like signal output (HDOD) protein
MLTEADTQRDVDARQASFRILKDIAADLSKGEVMFPTFANAVVKVKKALDDADMDAGRLARVISSEPLLSTKLVHIANSAALNPSGATVSDVKSAVTRVGFNTVRSVATAVAISQLEKADDLRKHRARAGAAWRHSVDVAVISFVVAKKMTQVNPEEALFAGMIHDIGYFYLLSKSSGYPELDAAPEALDDVLRDWHAPIGQSVLHAYQLSDATLAAVVQHEDGRFSSPPRTICDVVAIANIVTANSNPIYLREGVSAPEIAVEPEIFKVLADSDAEIRQLVSALQP